MYCIPPTLRMAVLSLLIGGHATAAPPERGPRRGDVEHTRQSRRPIEEGGPRAPVVDPARAERLHHIELTDQRGCPLDAHPQLVRTLLALSNRSQLMSLELWGDSHAYTPFQSVIYYMRSPRPSFVTLYWMGPKGDIFVPFSNLRIPADRNVSVDPHSIVVPPLGREQWVAVATLEPIPFTCHGTDATLTAMMRQVRALPHAVGRWEVWSSRDATTAPPDRPQDDATD